MKIYAYLMSILKGRKVHRTLGRKTIKIRREMVMKKVHQLELHDIFVMIQLGLYIWEERNAYVLHRSTVSF